MQYTNVLKLPEAIVDAIRYKDYDKGDCDIGLTTLMDSPQIRHLSSQPGVEMTEDVSQNIWALLGRAVHVILERANKNDLVEKRYYYDWPVSPTYADLIQRDTIRIGFTPDRLALYDGVLDDYKVASVWEVILGTKRERILQLSGYRLLLSLLGMPVEKSRLIYILRDWQKSKAGINGYPMRQVEIVEPTLLTHEETSRLINKQIARHFAPLEAGLSFCTSDETWATEDKWAVSKPWAKRAIKLFSSETEAQAFAAQLDEKVTITHRPGDWRRCATNSDGFSYCRVAALCPQWRAEQQRRSITNEEDSNAEAHA